MQRPSRFRRAILRAATVSAVAAAVLACNVPIYKVAVTDWPREPYALVYCTQEGLKANSEVDRLLETGFKSWMEFVNLDRVRIDVKRPVFQEDKELLARRGVRSLPCAVLVDKDGEALTTASGPVTAETWKAFEAATKPAGAFTLLAFTSPRGGPVVADPKAATPLPLTVIDFNQATDEQLERATALGIDRWRVPHAVLLDKDGKKAGEIVGQPLDAAAWAKLTRIASPQGPFKVVVFTKTELGAPAAEVVKVAPFPVTVVDLDKPDKEGQALAKALQVANLPYLSVMSPTGNEIASYQAALPEADLRTLVDSPKRAEIVKELKGRIAILLLVRSGDAKKSDAMLKVAKEGISRGERLFGGKIGLVELDPADEREAVLFKNLRLPRDGKDVYVVAVFGWGKVLAVPPLKGDFKSDDVLDVVQVVMQNCSCVVQPSDLGEDLLLNWPVAKAPRE